MESTRYSARTMLSGLPADIAARSTAGSSPAPSRKSARVGDEAGSGPISSAGCRALRRVQVALRHFSHWAPRRRATREARLEGPSVTQVTFVVSASILVDLVPGGRRRPPQGRGRYPPNSVETARDITFLDVALTGCMVRQNGTTHGTTGSKVLSLKYWWSQTGSNRRPLACHASALPAELWPHVEGRRRYARP